METRIGQGTPALDVARTESAPRVTPAAGVPFREMLARGTGAIVRGAQAAIMSLPGAPVVAAAVRPGTSNASISATSTTLPLTPTPGVPSGTAENPVGTAAGTSGAATSSQSVEQTLAQSQDFNLYYLQLQEQLSAENRSYTAMSNVLKARHDTVKNAIGNIR